MSVQEGAPEEAAERKDRRRRRARVGWSVVVGVVVSAIGAAAAAGTLLSKDEQPVTLGSLGSGTCFRLPAPEYVKKHTADSDGFPRLVVRAPCGDPHLGEVVEQAALEPARAAEAAGGSEVVTAAACRQAFTRANPDYWAPSPNVVLTAVPPSKKDVSVHPSVTCLYLGRSFMITGSLRADTSRLTAAQRRYLDAVDPYNEVSADGLDLKNGVTGDELIPWAGEMAAVEQGVVANLEKLGAPAGAEEAFTRILERHRAAQAAWQAVAPGNARGQIAAARDAEQGAMDAANAVRAALGLSTTARPKGWSL